MIIEEWSVLETRWHRRRFWDVERVFFVTFLIMHLAVIDESLLTAAIPVASRRILTETFAPWSGAFFMFEIWDNNF